MSSKRFNDFYSAYHFLTCHAIFEGEYTRHLYVEVVKVDPVTKCIESDTHRNTETNVWFETGPAGFHDLDLDCGGATYEEATIKLANLIFEKYGTEQAEPKPWVCEVIL